MKEPKRACGRIASLAAISCLFSCGWFASKPIIQDEDGRLDAEDDEADTGLPDSDAVPEMPGTCLVDQDCSDGEPCNGNEACSAENRCVAGTPLPDGTLCSSSSVAWGICRGFACVPHGCGNGEVDGGEECDDGNDIGGDGCENDCTYSCTRDEACRDSNICNGEETCAMGAHACVPGVPLADGYVCLVDPRSICLGGECLASVCGDAFVDPGAGEFCEPALDPECRADCTSGCTGGEDCPDDGEACNGREYCNDGTHACDRGAPLPDGTPCGISTDRRELCLGGTCRESVCGDLFVDAGADVPEECEDGNAVDGDGCDGDCTFSCHTDDECGDIEICNGTETCDTGSTHACQAGWNAPSGTACDDGLFCTDIDACDGSGSCAGTGDPCYDAMSCTADACDEERNVCSNPVQEGFCLIEGRCYDNGVTNPANPCQECNHAAQATGWTAKADTDWAEGPAGCNADSQRCFGGVCRVCSESGGWLHADGLGGLGCWHSAAVVQSCTDACGAFGGCVPGGWNDDTSCTVVFHFTARCDTCGSWNSSAAPQFQVAPHDCYYRSPAWPQSCEAIETGGYYPDSTFRLCVCND